MSMDRGRLALHIICQVFRFDIIAVAGLFLVGGDKFSSSKKAAIVAVYDEFQAL